MPTSNMKWAQERRIQKYIQARYYKAGIMQHKIGEIHAADIEKGEIMCEELNAWITGLV
jgi:hypothetical protein